MGKINGGDMEVRAGVVLLLVIASAVLVSLVVVVIVACHCLRKIVVFLLTMVYWLYLTWQGTKAKYAGRWIMAKQLADMRVGL